MSFISQQAGYWFLVIFGISMILITWFFARWKNWRSKEGFLVDGRKVGWFLGGTSIAASWVWAPALFLSSQFAYQMGLAGIFWFTAPNIVALAIFFFLGPKIRKQLPEGYTLPQFIKYKLQSNKVHKMYLFPYFFYQIMAITVQIFAGGSLIFLLTGIPLIVIMPILLIIALAYTLISGLEASVITDFIQIAMIFVIGAIILPLAWIAAGGTSAILAGLGGIANVGNIFDPGIAFSFGIVTSISLLAGSISDQQYWQRTFAMKRGQIGKAFIFGALVFAVIPIALSTLGFLGANPALGIVLPEGVDASMIGVQTVASLLPVWMVFLFVIMLLAGLSSTLDSGFSAASALWVTDVLRKKSDRSTIRQARLAMLGIAIIGLALAYTVNAIPQFGLFQLFWILNAAGMTVAVPTVLSLYWKRLSARGVFWGILAAFVIGLPLFIYGNILGSNALIVMSSLFMIMVSTLFCLAFPKKFG